MSKTLKIKTIICCLTVFWLSGFNCAIAQVTANATLDPERIETGDTFVLRVLVAGTQVQPKQVDFRAWATQIPGNNILSKSGWQRSGDKWVQHFTGIAFDGGTLDLPPLTVRLERSDTALTNPLRLVVWATPAKADLSDMESIRDIRREPVKWTDYWPWALGGIVFLIFLIWFTRKKRPPVVLAVPQAPSAPPIPAYELALQKLSTLESQKAWKKGDIKEFYAELSIIIREYLENRYTVAALESTTSEIMDLLKSTGFPKIYNKTLQEMLSNADMVKYARSQPPETAHEKAIQNARSLVEQTKPEKPRQNI